MASTTTPLLINGRGDDTDSDTEDATLRGRAHSTHSGRSWHLRLRETLVFAWALLATGAVLVATVWQQPHNHPSNKPVGKRNLIFMVSDGMGPASLSMTRSFRQHTKGLEWGDTLTLDKHFWGSSRTRSSSSLVTDSAAGATAFSCAKKSYNGAISILPDSTPCGTVLEAAKYAGYLTGLVVTTDITDATPACFASHVDFREQWDEIALQEVGEGPLGRVVDLMFGGGRCHFLPNNTAGVNPSCRGDHVDVVAIAKQNGFIYLDSRAGFDEFSQGKKTVSLPMLGLFADHNIPFELDRRARPEKFPSLSEMAKTALMTLESATADSDKGFFLMIEGSRIDHAGHENDPAAQVNEVLEYDKAFESVITFLRESKTPGVLVATSDHETGGLSVARQTSPEYPDYVWYPTVLANVSHSSEFLTIKYWRHLLSGNAELQLHQNGTLKSWIKNELIIPGLGITDSTREEITALVEHPMLAVQLLSRMISVRAQIGWTSEGHTAVDVNIYSSGGPGTNAIRGNVENTDVGQFLRDYLDVDVDSITKRLVERMKRKAKDSRDMVSPHSGFHGTQYWTGLSDLEMLKLRSFES